MSADVEFETRARLAILRLLSTSTKSSARKFLRRYGFWLGLGAAAILFAVLLYSQTFRDAVEGAIIWAKEIMSANPVLGAAVFFLFAVCDVGVYLERGPRAFGKSCLGTARYFSAALGRMGNGCGHRVWRRC